MKNLFKALAAFQQEVKAIHQDNQGYGYTYANLSTIFETINPILKKHGLGFTQPISGTSVKTIIFHSESGELLESETAIPQGVELKGMNQFQVLGSAITYIRRYSLSSALGLITDKDIDGSGEQVKSESKPTKSETDDKKWLNKYMGKDSKVETKEWIAVVSALNSGNYTIADVEKKYKLSKELKTELSAL